MCIRDRQVGGAFLHSNHGLKKLDLPNLEQVGYYFLSDNRCV